MILLIIKIKFKQSIPTNIMMKYGSMINLSTQYIDNNYVYKIGGL